MTASEILADLVAENKARYEMEEGEITVCDMMGKTGCSYSTVLRKLNSLVSAGKLSRRKVVLNGNLQFAYKATDTAS